MARLLINALSATNLSSRNVIRGWIEGLSRLGDDSYHIIVLAPHDYADELPRTAEVTIRRGPRLTTHWTSRRIWELGHLGRLIIEHEATAVLHFSGIAIPGLRIPQYAFFHNPLPFLIEERRTGSSPGARLKAAIQVKAIRNSAPHINGVIVPSNYMHALVAERLPEITDLPAAVVPHGRAEVLQGDEMKIGRDERIVTVSNWAPHKNLETMLKGLSLLEEGTALEIIGPWASARYRRKIESLVRHLGLSTQVSILGHLNESELRERVRTARLFCLLSRSESFGLPALDAQALGTPVVVSADSAMAEICAAGSVLVDATDVTAVVRGVRDLLSDDERWRRLSDAATQNARTYSWEMTASRMTEFINATSPTVHHPEVRV